MTGLSQVATIDHVQWTADPSAEIRASAILALECGDVLWFPGLAFEISSDELRDFSPEIVGPAKNVGFDPGTGKVGGTVLAGDRLRSLSGMLERYSRRALALIDGSPRAGTWTCDG